MKKIGVISDIHFGLKTYVAEESVTNYSPDPITNRDSELMGCLYTTLEQYIKIEVDYIFIAGDIFNNNHPAQIYQDLFWKWVKDAIKALPKVKIIIIPGNHDAINTSKSLNAVTSQARLTEELPNILIFNSIGFKEFDEFFLLHVPHVNRNYYSYAAKIKSIADIEKEFNKYVNTDIQEVLNKLTICKQKVGQTKPVIFLGHGYLKGTTPGLEVSFEHFYCVFRKFPEIDYYIIGHVHRYQEKGNVIIPGSVIYNDFAEEKENKRILVCSLNEGTLTTKTYDSPARKVYTCNLLYNKGEIKFPQISDYQDKIIRIIVEVEDRSEQKIAKQGFPLIREKFKEAFMIESINVKVKNIGQFKSSAEMSYRSMTDVALLKTFLVEKYPGTENKALVGNCIKVFVDEIEPKFLGVEE